MLRIILSKNDNNLNRARRILECNSDHVNIVYVEDILNKSEKINYYDIIYIMNDNQMLEKLLEMLNKFNFIIINKEFFIKKYNKLTLKNSLMKFKIKFPETICFKELDKCVYPLYVKHINHSSTIIKASSYEEIQNFFIHNDKSKYYFEKAVDTRKSKEYKIYFINNNIYYYDGEKEHHEILKKICLRISILCKLTVFSADFIKNNDEFYVIDINPMPGFYMSINARISLIKYAKFLEEEIRKIEH